MYCLGDFDTRTVVVVTGVAGELGHDVMNEVAARKYKCFGTDLATFYPNEPDGTMITRLPYCSMDCKNYATVDRVCDSVRIDVIIHCATTYYTKTAENLAKVCKRLGAKLIFVERTDRLSEVPARYQKPGYEEGNIEAAMKKAEKIIFDILDEAIVVRTQWLYGMQGGEYVRERLVQGEGTRQVVLRRERSGVPTYTRDLARLLVDMVDSKAYGIYDLTKEIEPVTEADFIRELFVRAGHLNKVVVRIPKAEREAAKKLQEEYEAKKAAGLIEEESENSEYGCPEKYRTLKEGKFRRLPSWQGAIARYLKEIRYRRRYRGNIPEKAVSEDDWKDEVL